MYATAAINESRPIHKIGQPPMDTRCTPIAAAATSETPIPHHTARGVSSPAWVTRIGPTRSASAPFLKS